MVEHDLEPGDALDQAAAQLEQEEGLVTSTDDDYIDFGDLDAVQPAPTRAQGKAAATEDTAAAADEDEAVVAAEEGARAQTGGVSSGPRTPPRVEPGAAGEPGGAGTGTGEPVTEPGADGKPQHVIPGTEPISSAELAKRRAAERLKPKVAQKPADQGLFGDTSQQTDLVDLTKKPEASLADQLAKGRSDLDRLGAARIGKIDYKIIEGKFGGYYYSRAENGIRVEKGGAGIGGKWSRDKALQEAMEDGPLAREVAPQHMPAYDLGYQRKPLPEGINNAEQAASDRGANDRMNADRAAANPRAELSAVQAKLPPGYTARDLGGFTWLRIDGPNGYGLETNSVEDALKEVRKHARPRTPQAPPMPGMTPLGAKPKPSKSEADEAMAKLTKLFGKNRKPGLSAPEDVLAETDDAVYADAKPPFIAAAEKFAEHKNNVGALVSAMVGELRSTHDWDRDMLEEAKPYFRRFINDVKTGVIDLAAGPKAPNLKEGGSSDEHPGTQGAGTKTLGGVAPGEGGCGRRGNWTRLSTGRQGRPRSRSTT